MAMSIDALTKPARDKRASVGIETS